MIELKSAVCPECGGRLVIDPLTPSYGKCKSCGYTTLIAGVPGFSAEKAAWINAVNALEDGSFDKADAYFKKIIDTKPDYGEAYFGRFECAIATAEYYRHLNSHMHRCLSDYISAVDNAVTQFGRRAIQYAADDSTKQEYEARINEVTCKMDELIEAATAKKKGFFSRFFG